MTAVFEEATSTTHNKVTDAILMWTEVGEGDLETMLGREPWMMRLGWVRGGRNRNHSLVRIPPDPSGN